MQTTLRWMAFLLVGWQAMDQTLAAGENSPPEVSILWPRQGDSFSAGTVIKIKADAADSDGSITQVQFFAETNLIGVVTNAPFNVIWYVDLHGAAAGSWNLKAVAFDNLGAKSESAPVTVFYYIGAGTRPVLEVIAALDGTLFPTPATFAFSAELLASLGVAAPVEFFLDTNSVGLVDQGGTVSATMPPASITVSNLLEGEYKLTVRFRGLNAPTCTCNWITNVIHVVRLGVQSPTVTPDGLFRFEVVTAFPGSQTIIQSSTNLVDWVPGSTNQPSSNTFTYTDPNPATNAQRFYRALVPP